ncbi:glutaredoxin family protein [Pontibacter sp. JAM-7]|uniref:glutaredoxin family protein n=1 Tax=Pontibacter sp. JAM-7 TaxID=3366581 RepID=UPI003AF7A7EA
MKYNLELLGTAGCHLCDVAAELLVTQLNPAECELYQVDIAEEDLIDTYGLRIPVLREVQSGAELDWPFDAEAICTFMQSLPGQG